MVRLQFYLLIGSYDWVNLFFLLLFNVMLQLVKGGPSAVQSCLIFVRSGRHGIELRGSLQLLTGINILVGRQKDGQAKMSSVAYGRCVHRAVGACALFDSLSPSHRRRLSASVIGPALSRSV